MKNIFNTQSVRNVSRLLLCIYLFLFGCKKFDPGEFEDGTITDIDGNVYQTVQIGEQIWMAENLKTTHYADGSAIPLVEGTSDWDSLNYSDKAYCWYDNSTANRDKYGGLYTWAGAMNGALSSNSIPSGIKGVCPDGWHLPSSAEWSELEIYLIANGYNWDGSTSGNKIAKSLASTKDWYESTEQGVVGYNMQGNNTTGFNALSAGDRYTGAFDLQGWYTNFWTSTEGGNEFLALQRGLGWNYVELLNSNANRRAGYSIRCVKD